MTFTYCDARHDGTPVNRCLCTSQVMHNGAHKCVYGHTWGIDWNQLTYDQQRELLGLHPRQILGLADAPDYWCPQIRDTRGGGTPRDPEWRAAGLWHKAYSWGIAITTPGDYMDERGIRAPEHAVTLTWQQITAWSESLPEERRAAARRARLSIHTTDENDAVTELLAPIESTPRAELTLF